MREVFRRLRTCCLLLCLLTLVAAVVLGILVWFYFPDTNPPVSSQFSLKTAGLKTDPLGLTLAGQVDVAVTNRNAYDILTKAGAFAVTYEEHMILEVPYPGTKLPAGRTSIIKMPVNVEISSESSPVHNHVLESIITTCRTPEASLLFVVQGGVSASTWFVPVWISIPIRQERRIPCSSLETYIQQAIQHII